MGDTVVFEATRTTTEIAREKMSVDKEVRVGKFTSNVIEYIKRQKSGNR